MSILKNINYILELDRIPCAQPSMWIIAKTAFQSAPPALLTLGVPGCTDIVKTRIGRSPWHAKGISNFIKKAIGPQALPGNKFLYQIGYNTIEKYLWWWMLADVTTEFITTWQSQIYQEQQCELPGAKTAHGYFEPFIYGEEGARHAILGIEGTTPGITAGLFYIMINPGRQGTVAYTIEWDSYPIPGGGANGESWYTINDGDERFDFQRTNDPALKNGKFTGGSFYHNRPGTIHPTRYDFWVNPKPEPGQHVRIVNGKWNASTQGRNEGNTSIGCNPKEVSWPFPSL